MKEQKIFFQDFLFENMPVDEQDFPTVDIKILTSDIKTDKYEVVSFDTMLRMNKPSEWEELFKRTDNKNVCIKDDVPMHNSEMEPYKDFYLKSYYYNLSKHSSNVYIMRKQ